MRIAALMNVHAAPEVVLDTVDSIRQHMTEDILVVIDGISKAFKDTTFPCYSLEGFPHGYYKAPYRNTALGLQHLWNMCPGADWYCYIEPDVLVASDEFKDVLAATNAWCLGNDYREGNLSFPLLGRLINREITASHYLLGCCVFYRRDFIKLLVEMDFFSRFLTLTQSFEADFFPGYNEQGGYDLSEHLYPTLAYALGGRVVEFGHWREGIDRWRGDSRYALRWRPELEGEYPEASLLHPVKALDHPARIRRRHGI